MIEISTVRDQVERFLTDTAEARVLSETCRDYFDHKQWTPEQVKIRKARKQSSPINNRVRPKIKGLTGLYELRGTDPKAYPRTKKHEKSAHAATDGLRYVADNNDFPSKRTEVAEEFFVEGYGGVTVDVTEKKGEPEIRIVHLPWDRIYYDPHSREKDFSDATYMGYYLWMYIDQVKEMFSGIDVDQLVADQGEDDETTEDRPRWVDKDRDRVRVAFHYALVKGVWQFGVFSGEQWLFNPIVSPFLDEDGEPACPMELVSANVDRDNNRYGEAAGFLDLQNSINYTLSKADHLNGSRQTHGRKGAVSDVAAMKREAAKPDGHIEWEGDEFGKDFGFIDTTRQMQGQLAFYQEAKAELDAVSVNAQLAGERQQGDLSGRAIEKLQAAGTLELNQDYAVLAGWEKRVYRQVWARIRQYWTEEKWIRVTDDPDTLRWVGFNTPMTMREHLSEMMADESLRLPDRRKVAAVFQNAFAQEQQMEDLSASEAASNFLEQIVGVSNPVAEIDIDIIIDQSFDVINSDEEKLNTLIQFAQGSDIDFIELIDLSGIRGKDKLIEKIEARRQQAAQAAGNAAAIAEKSAQADLMLKATQADKTQSEADQKKVETNLLLASPDWSPQAVI